MRGTASGGSPVSWDSHRSLQSLSRDKSWLLREHEAARSVQASERNVNHSPGRWPAEEHVGIGQGIAYYCLLFPFCWSDSPLGDAYSEGILVSRERTIAMSKGNLSRRQFLNRSVAVAGTGFAIGGTRSTGRVIGANDTVRVAIAGLNGRGGAHVDEYVKMPGVTITYLVDPDTRTFDKRIHQIESHGGSMHHRPHKTFAESSMTRTWMWSRSRRPITGTRS